VQRLSHKADVSLRLFTRGVINVFSCRGEGGWMEVVVCRAKEETLALKRNEAGGEAQIITCPRERRKK
jgi:hypothetical protein